MKKVLTGILILLLIVLGLAWIKNSERNVAGKIKQFASDTGQKIVDVTQDAAERIENGASELASSDTVEEAVDVADESIEQAADKVKMALLQEEKDIEAATNNIKKQADASVEEAKEIQAKAGDELDKESERARASIDKLLATKSAPKPAMKDDKLPAAEDMMISKKGDENVKLVPIGKSADPVAAAVAKADKVAPAKQETAEAKEEIKKVAKIEKPKEVQQAVAAMEKDKPAKAVPAKLVAQKKKTQVAAPKKNAGPSWISFQSPRKKLVVNYSPDSYQLTEATRKALDAYIAVAKETPLRTLRVVGHSEKTGSVLEERKMSYLRTRQIVEYLITQGVEPSSIHSDHLGSKLPLASNATENGKTRNRRVEVHVRQN